MLVLYHGDTSVCSQKVRLVLFEKDLEWSGKFIDLSKGDQFAPEYIALNPNAVVPTLVDGDQVIIESTMINEYLDDAFPEIPLRPADPYDKARMRLWVKQLDDTVHYAINTISFAIAFRRPLLALSEEERTARYEGIPDPARREKMKSLITEGVKSPLMAEAIKRLDKLLGDMETRLDESEWLAGGTYSLADTGLTPYVNRMAMLSLAPMWEQGRPRLTDWYARVKARGNYRSAVLDYDPPDRIKLMNEAGAELWPEIAPLVDGKTRTAAR